MQEVSVWLYDQMIYVKTLIFPGEFHAQNSLGNWDTNYAQPEDQASADYEKKIFALSADNGLKIKGNWKRY